MRFLKFLLTLFIIIVCLGFGAYHFGTKAIANKVTDVLTDELENEETLASIKAEVDRNPKVKQFIEEGATVNEAALPFTTKEEAVETVMKKIGVNELRNLQSQYESGISMAEVEQLIDKYQNKLTDEEILALKAIAYKELYQ